MFPRMATVSICSGQPSLVPGGDRRARSITANGDAAAIGFNLFLRRTGLRLGRGIKFHQRQPKAPQPPSQSRRR